MSLLSLSRQRKISLFQHHDVMQYTGTNEQMFDHNKPQKQKINTRRKSCVLRIHLNCVQSQKNPTGGKFLGHYCE